jgi:hypothetical protein
LSWAYILPTKDPTRVMVWLKTIDRTLLKNAVASNDDFFSFEEVIDAQNQAHNVEVRVEDFIKLTGIES